MIQFLERQRAKYPRHLQLPSAFGWQPMLEPTDLRLRKFGMVGGRTIVVLFVWISWTGRLVFRVPRDAPHQFSFEPGEMQSLIRHFQYKETP